MRRRRCLAAAGANGCGVGRSIIVLAVGSLHGSFHPSDSRGCRTLRVGRRPLGVGAGDFGSARRMACAAAWKLPAARALFACLCGDRLWCHPTRPMAPEPRAWRSGGGGGGAGAQVLLCECAGSLSTLRASTTVRSASALLLACCGQPAAAPNDSGGVAGGWWCDGAMARATQRGPSRLRPLRQPPAIRGRYEMWSPLAQSALCGRARERVPE